MIHAILSGGSGTRLWPLSRTLFPKQFCKLFNHQSLFIQAVLRNRSLCNRQIALTNGDQYFLALNQLEDLGIHNMEFLIEPVGRNTAPAIAFVCFFADPEEVVLVTPSDHIIRNQEAYEKALKTAENLAKEGSLVTFGILPSSPETEFGYIEARGNDVLSFKEKPSLEKAKEYLSLGNYYWNSGMFCFQAKIFLEELRQYSPEIYEASLSAYKKAYRDKVIRIQKEDMLAIPSNSIDYAVLEKSKKVKVVPVDMGWSDLGSFESLKEELKGQTSSTDSEVININSNNNLILSESRTVTTIDVDDLIVVDTPDALLISKHGSSKKVKQAVEILIQKQSSLPQTHKTVPRPWGSFTVLEEKQNYKIKQIEVKPGKKLSLQKHQHRSERWTVLYGTAKVTVGSEILLLKAHETVYIPLGEIHRLENPGPENMAIVEVQLGNYLGEDDIIRLEDDYRRV